MFGKDIQYRSCRDMLKMGRAYCYRECYFYETKQCKALGKKYKQCRKFAIERTGEPNNWFKRIRLWLTA